MTDAAEVECLSVDHRDPGPIVRNRADGMIEIPILANIDSPKRAGQNVLSYETSPQETALLNVSGDSGNFDLLAVESAAGPAGDYSATVMAAEEVVIEMHSRRSWEQRVSFTSSIPSPAG